MERGYQVDLELNFGVLGLKNFNNHCPRYISLKSPSVASFLQSRLCVNVCGHQGDEFTPFTPGLSLTSQEHTIRHSTRLD